MAQVLVKPKVQFFDDNGDPLVGGKVYTYEAGTTTPLATYTDKDEGTPNANPVILDSRGEADIWLSNANYKVVVHNSEDVEIYTVDDVKSINNGVIDTDKLANSSVTTQKIANKAVTFDKIASGALGNVSINSITEDYTITENDEVILIDAIAGAISVSLPPAASSNEKKIKLIRVDDNNTKTDTFLDGDITLGTETINMGSHPFTNTQRVQLTTTGTLPTGLALSTDYYVIYVDANNIKLASSKADAEIGTAVNITAASGGGTHTITSQANTITINGYLSEKINGVNNKDIELQYDFLALVCDGAQWLINAANSTSNLIAEEKLYLGSTSEEVYLTKGSGDSAEVYIDGNKTAEFDSDGITLDSIADGLITYEKLESLNYQLSSSTGTYSTSSTSFTNITNASVSITTSGRPVLVALIHDASAFEGYVFAPNVTNLRIYRDSTSNLITHVVIGSNYHHFIGGIDVVAAGTYTYQAQIKANTGSTNVYRSRLLAVEL